MPMSANSKNSPGGEAGSSPGRSLPRLPPLRALAAFKAAAQHASFAKGAAELGVTPSAISHQVQQLEDFLGVALFRRQAGRAVLTAAGRTYAGEIEQAFSAIAAATERVAPQSQREHLVVASSPSFAVKWLQPRMQSFLRSHPEARIRISTLSERDDIESERFDLAITYGRPAHTAMSIEPFLLECLRPLCSPELAASIGLRTPRDLARTTLIHSVNALTWADYLRRVGEVALRPRNELWLDRSLMAVEAAVSGLGVVLESEVLAADELRDGRLIAPFAEQGFAVETTSYFLIRPLGVSRGSLARAFEAWLLETITAENLAKATARQPTGHSAKTS
jgi:LysR family glycine cleavage system transcriptional activator